MKAQYKISFSIFLSENPYPRFSRQKITRSKFNCVSPSFGSSPNDKNENYRASKRIETRNVMQEKRRDRKFNAIKFRNNCIRQRIKLRTVNNDFINLV